MRKSKTQGVQVEDTAPAPFWISMELFIRLFKVVLSIYITVPDADSLSHDRYLSLSLCLSLIYSWAFRFTRKNFGRYNSCMTSFHTQHCMHGAMVHVVRVPLFPKHYGFESGKYKLHARNYALGVATSSWKQWRWNFQHSCSWRSFWRSFKVLSKLLLSIQVLFSAPAPLQLVVRWQRPQMCLWIAARLRNASL